MSSGVQTLCEWGWYPPRLSSRRRSMASFSESSTSSTRRVPVTGALFAPASRNFGLLGGDRTVPDILASKREVERGPLTHRSLRPDPAAVPVDDASYRRQAYPRPLELILPVQPLEGAEELVCIRLVEAGPVVAHVVNGGWQTWAGCPVGAELYARLFFPGGELPRVAEQVLERHLEQARICPGHNVLSGHELDFSFRLRCPKFLDYPHGEAGQVHAFPAQGPASNPREVEQVVYKGGHVSARRPYSTEEIHTLVIERVLVVLLQYL